MLFTKYLFILIWTLFCTYASAKAKHKCVGNGFAALLFNPTNMNRTCVGAIISHYWVLDNCPEKYDGLNYTSIMVAWNYPLFKRVYGIERMVGHPKYYRQNFTIKNYNTNYIYAAKSSVFLHRTTTAINMVPGLVFPITISHDYILPKQGCAVHLMKGIMVRTCLWFTSNDVCDKHFEKYFETGKQLYLETDQFCVNTKRWISPETCCYSQPLMVKGCNILIGVNAWSSGCSEELGVDPWVFNNLAYYLPWIKQNID